MKSTTLESISPFGQATLALDKQLENFNRFTSQLCGLELNTDTGFNKAVNLLSEIEKTRESLQSDMLSFSDALKTAKTLNEENEARIASLVPQIQARQQTASHFLERMKLFGSAVGTLNESIGAFKEKSNQALSDIERQEIAAQLQEVDSKLEILANEATKMVEDARAANMKALEREADSLRKSLCSSRNKLKLLYTKH